MNRRLLADDYHIGKGSLLPYVSSLTIYSPSQHLGYVNRTVISAIGKAVQVTPPRQPQ